MNKLKYMTVPVTNFKVDETKGTFTAYANVKNIIDHAMDRCVNGCYQKSIENHLRKGTMPKMLWSHNPTLLPVGKWTNMVEDDKGLLMEGVISKTVTGKDIEILAKDGALSEFSIGYIIVKEKWNTDLTCNDLIEIDVKEVSWVNFACNEMSLLQDIKSKIKDGGLPTKRELQNFLRENGLSKSQAEAVTNRYDDKSASTVGNEVLELELFR